jgi:hypothetical protein
MTRSSLLAVSTLGLCIAGCTIRTGDLTLVATKNIPSTREADVRGQYEASDCKVFGVPNVEEAIDRTIEKGNGNALTDAVLYQDSGFFQNCFRAKGTVVRLKERKE